MREGQGYLQEGVCKKTYVLLMGKPSSHRPLLFPIKIYDEEAIQTHTLRMLLIKMKSVSRPGT